MIQNVPRLIWFINNNGWCTRWCQASFSLEPPTPPDDDRIPTEWSSFFLWLFCSNLYERIYPGFPVSNGLLTWVEMMSGAWRSSTPATTEILFHLMLRFVVVDGDDDSGGGFSTTWITILPQVVDYVVAPPLTPFTNDIHRGVCYPVNVMQW